jgi:hypothetical protein
VHTQVIKLKTAHERWQEENYYGGWQHRRGRDVYECHIEFNNTMLPLIAMTSCAQLQWHESTGSMNAHYLQPPPPLHHSSIAFYSFRMCFQMKMMSRNFCCHRPMLVESLSGELFVCVFIERIKFEIEKVFFITLLKSSIIPAAAAAFLRFRNRKSMIARGGVESNPFNVLFTDETKRKWLKRENSERAPREFMKTASKVNLNFYKVLLYFNFFCYKVHNISYNIYLFVVSFFINMMCVFF